MKIFILLFTYLALSMQIFAQTKPIITLQNGAEMMNIGAQVSFLEDKEGKLSIEQINSPELQSKFIASDKQVLHFQLSESWYWIKIEIQNQATKQDWVLEITEAKIEFANLYFQDQNQKWSSIENGYAIPTKKKYKQHYFQVFPLSFEQGNRSVFYLKTKGNAQAIPLKILTEVDFESNHFYKNLLYGLYLGVLLFITLYNLIFSLMTKILSYLLYSAVVACYLLSAMVLNGYIKLFWDTDLLHLFRVSALLTFVFMVLYAKDYLNIDKKSNSGKFIMFLLGLDMSLFCSLFLFNSLLTFVLVQSLAMLVLFSIIVFAFLALKNKKQFTYYYLYAFLIFTLFSTLEFIHLNTGYLPYFYVSHVELGWLSEVLILYFALNQKFAFKQRQAELEKEKAQAEALLQMQKNELLIRDQNYELEQKVQERTEKLDIRTQELNNSLQILFDQRLKMQVQNEKLQASEEELKASEEELRQNLEELQAMQDKLLMAQAEQEQANEVFRALFDYSTNPHLLFDKTGIVNCNAATISLLGYESKENILNLHPAKLSPEIQPDGKNSDKKAKEMDSLAKEKGYHRFEWTHRKADGTDFPVEVTLNPIKIQNKEALLVVWYDLSERKRQEEQLKAALSKSLKLQAELQARMIVLDRTALLTETDLHGNITYANQKFLETSKYSLEEVLGKPHHIIRHPENPKSLFTKMWKNIKAGMIFKAEYPNLAKDGATYWVDATIAPVLNENKKPYKYIGIRFDTTKSKENEAYIQYQNNELKINEEELRKNLEELTAAQESLQTQKLALEEKNKKVTSSINYALRIQRAVLPAMSEIQQCFPQSFIFYQPKDIVSGDFYFFANKENCKILAVADCTGHGVPGAFMTMIGNNILNQIVHDLEIYAPDQILNLMSNLLEKTLSNSEQQVQDGMDISILTIYDHDAVEYAGAKNDLYYIQNQEFKIAKADRTAIGGKRKADFSYQKHEIKLSGSTIFYLFTDGFQDQFGGDGKSRFSSKRFRSLISEIYEQPMSAQEEIFRDTIFGWQELGASKQIDDITLIGFRLENFISK